MSDDDEHSIDFEPVARSRLPMLRDERFDLHRVSLANEGIHFAVPAHALKVIMRGSDKEDIASAA